MERNEIVGKYGVSGYAGSEDITERWNVRVTDDAEFEEKFKEWCPTQDVFWRKQTVQELQAQARIIESG
eukprot:7717546-Alexandrium_andersonii.AAC.1